MKKLYTLLLGIAILLLVGCKDEATIEITNNIKNVKLEYVSFGDDVPVTTSLLSGEKAAVTIDNKMDNISFPVKARVIFYMTAGDHKVLLYTQEEYNLDKDETLRIVLTDNTEVINPATNVSTGDDDDDDNTSATISQIHLSGID